ncbi:MAG: collagen-like protein [Solirubrobacterales bacterium]
MVALLALFVALSGASYAAVQLPRNSVGSKQIRSNAVVSSKVRNGSLRAEDFMAGQLPRGERGERGETGERGPAGERGAAGSTGATGAEGPRGPSDLYWAVGADVTSLPNTATDYTIASIIVPPGNYLVSASLTVKALYNTSMTTEIDWQVNCYLTPLGDAPIATGFAGSRAAQLNGGNDSIPMSLQAALEKTAAVSSVTVSLRCSQSTNPGGTAGISVYFPTITAIRVATSTAVPN